MDMEHVASEFFQAHPQLETLDLSVVDINGSLRGKRLPASAFAAAGRPFAQSGRQVLKNVVARFHARGLRPTVAIELEFYLIEKELDRYGMPRLLDDAGQAGTQGLSLDDLDKAGAFIERVRECAVLQSVPASAEYAPGQFEINLRHSRNPVNACDDAVYVKLLSRIKHAECAEFNRRIPTLDIQWYLHST